MVAPSHVHVSRDDEIAVVTIDRQEKMNALNPALLAELGRTFDSLGEDGSVRGVLLTGAGEKAFVAGADIDDLAGLAAPEATELSRRGQSVLLAIERFPKPVVAAVGGHALGGGCELALACHVRVASENARFGLPEVRLGTIPGYGGTLRLARIVGLGRALEMILTGDAIDARRAFEVGLVSEVCPRADLVDSGLRILRRITRNGPVAVRMALEAVRRALDVPTEEALALESSLFGLLASTRDMQEGVAAFLEKRKPTFEGC